MIRILFTKHCFHKEKVGPKNGKGVRKIEFPMDSVPEFELRDTAPDIQQRREEREERKREEEAQKQGEEAKRKETRHSPEEGVAKKSTRTNRSYIEMGYMHRGWRRGGHISVALKTKEGAHGQHLPDSD